MTETTGSGSSVKNRGLRLRTGDETTRYPVAKVVSEIGLSDITPASKILVK